MITHVNELCTCSVLLHCAVAWSFETTRKEKKSKGEKRKHMCGCVPFCNICPRAASGSRYYGQCHDFLRNDCFGSPRKLSYTKIVLTEECRCSQNTVFGYKLYCTYTNSVLTLRVLPEKSHCHHTGYLMTKLRLPISIFLLWVCSNSPQNCVGMLKKQIHLFEGCGYTMCGIFAQHAFPRVLYNVTDRGDLMDTQALPHAISLLTGSIM